MLPRKNRTTLALKQHEDEKYPTIIIGLKDPPTPESSHEISVLDINTSGMGITCSVTLSVGQCVYFNDEQMEWDLPRYGIVMWTFQDNDGFRAGIKFA